MGRLESPNGGLCGRPGTLKVFNEGLDPAALIRA